MVQVSLLASLVSGKAFRELVSPAMLKAYEWQVRTLDSSEGEASDIFDTSNRKGISLEAVRMLPKFEVRTLSVGHCGERPCAICLQVSEKR